MHGPRFLDALSRLLACGVAGVPRGSSVEAQRRPLVFWAMCGVTLSA